jgi:hypothetical protein
MEAERRMVLPGAGEDGTHEFFRGYALSVL